MVSCKARQLRLTLAKFDMMKAMMEEDDLLMELILGYLTALESKN